MPQCPDLEKASGSETRLGTNKGRRTGRTPNNNQRYKDMEKIIRNEAIGETIMLMAEIADRSNAKLTVEITTDNGHKQIKVTLWGRDYTILGDASFLAGNTALEARDAVSELERDMKSRGNM